MKKAYLVTYHRTEAVVAAETRGKALFAAVGCLRELGYQSPLPDTKIRRAPDFDQWAEIDETGAFWDPNVLPRNTTARSG